MSGVEGISILASNESRRCKSSRPNSKLLSMKEGAPGPPNRTIEPRRIRVGTTFPVAGLVTRTPFTKVPWALPQSTM